MRKRMKFLIILGIPLVALIITQPAKEKEHLDIARELSGTGQLELEDLVALKKFTRVDIGKLLVQPNNIGKALSVELQIRNASKDRQLVLRERSCSCVVTLERLRLLANETVPFSVNITPKNPVGRFAYFLKYEDVLSTEPFIFQVTGEIVPQWYVSETRRSSPSVAQISIGVDHQADSFRILDSILFSRIVKSSGNKLGIEGVLRFPEIQMSNFRTETVNRFGELFESTRVGFELATKSDESFGDLFNKLATNELTGFVDVLADDDKVSIPITLFDRREIKISPSSLLLVRDNKSFQSTVLRVKSATPVPRPTIENNELFDIDLIRNDDGLAFDFRIQPKRGENSSSLTTQVASLKIKIGSIHESVKVFYR